MDLWLNIKLFFIVGQDTLRDSQDHDLGPAISHFFNCFVGNVLSPSEKGATDSTHSKAQKKVQEDLYACVFYLQLLGHYDNVFLYVPL